MTVFVEEIDALIAERQKEIAALTTVKAMLVSNHAPTVFPSGDSIDDVKLPTATTGAPVKKKPSLRPGDVQPRNPNVYCKACGANVVSKEHAEKCGHAHRWRIASPNGSLSEATCQIDGCEATAQFANSMDSLGRVEP